MAIGANLTFSTASMIFSFYAKKYSPMWINQVKVCVAFVAFIIAILLGGEFSMVSSSAVILLFVSGLIGLCVGDIFLFRAYATLGAGRSLVLFSFQPLLLGIYGYFFLQQIFTFNQSLAVACMVICIYIFMLERNRLIGSWDHTSFFWAFSGICLDAFGVMLTRSAYEISPELETFQVNAIRCAGALVGFLLIRPSSYLKVFRDIKIMQIKEQMVLL